MKTTTLIRALDATYQTDLVRFTALRSRLATLDSKRTELLSPVRHGEQVAVDLELAGIASRHLGWRQREAHKLSRAIFELQPELAAAKQKLKKSFGRLEAMKQLIERGEL